MNYRNTGLICLLACITIIILNKALDVSAWWILLPVLIYIHLLVLGAIFIQWNFYVKSVNSLDDFYGVPETLRKKNICLTFDDGIHPVNTPKTLDILAAKNIRAHFFIIGKNIPGNEAILERMHSEGHLIGNHSKYHFWNFDLQTAAKMKEEIMETNRMIRDVIHRIPILFRPPYGVTNPNLAKAVRESGLRSIGWNLRSLDTVAKSAEELFDKLKRKTKPGAIVLLHERCDVTVNTLTDYIEYCEREGYTFATLKPAYEA